MDRDWKGLLMSMSDENVPTIADLREQNVAGSGEVHAIDPSKALTPDNMRFDKTPKIPPPHALKTMDDVTARMKMYEKELATALARVSSRTTEKDVVSLIKRYKDDLPMKSVSLLPVLPPIVRYNNASAVGYVRPPTPPSHGDFSLEYSVDGGATWILIDTAVDGVVP